MADFTFNLTNSLIEDSVTAQNTQTYQPVTFTDPSINKNVVKDVNIAAGATDTEISLDGLTGKHLRLAFSATVSVKLNGTGNSAITLTPSSNNPAGMALWGCNVTSLFVSNPGGSPVECKLILMAE